MRVDDVVNNLNDILKKERNGMYNSLSENIVKNGQRKVLNNENEIDEVVIKGGISLQKTSSNENIARLVAGGLSGMIAKSIIAPLDRTKILFQVTNEQFKMTKIPRLMKEIYSYEGVRGLWKGNSAMMMRIFPYAGIQFMTFDIWKKAFTNDGNGGYTKKMKFFESLCGGAVAGAISTLFTYPLDLARSQIAVHNCDHRKTNIYTVLKDTYEQGGKKAFFRGVVPSLYGIIPYAGIAFTINDRLKSRAIQKRGKVSTAEKLSYGGIAGIIAQTIAYPFEVIRRRMQTSGLIDRNSMKSGYAEIGNDAVIQHASKARVRVLDTLQIILKEQGIKGFFKGVSLNWIKGPITISISFTCFDILKGMLGVQKWSH